MNAAQQGVSITAALICLVIAFILWKPGHKHWPFVVFALVLTGAAGLTATKLASWVSTAEAWLVTELGKLIQYFGGPTAVVSGALIAALIAIYILGHVAFDVFKHKSIDDSTLYWTAAIPFTASAIPGAAGGAIATAIGVATSGVASAILSIFHLG